MRFVARTLIRLDWCALKLCETGAKMPHPVGRPVAEKIRIQLIEADMEIGFNLVDEANAYRASGRSEASLLVLQNAEQILADIEMRLGLLGDQASSPFRPLLAELRNEIAAAGHRTS